MLVLTRKIEEKVLIGDNITVTVLGVREGQVVLGFEAPSEITILRKEVKEKSSKQGRPGIKNEV